MQTLAHVLVTALRLQQWLRPAILDQGLIPALRWLWTTPAAAAV